MLCDGSPSALEMSLAGVTGGETFGIRLETAVGTDVDSWVDISITCIVDVGN